METKTLVGTLNDMPGNARVWVYQANRDLSVKEQEEITEATRAFLQEWAAHGNALVSGFEIVQGRFLVLAVNEDIAHATGCSIDKMVQHFQRVDDHFKIDLFNRLRIAFKDEGILKEIPMAEFTEKLKSGELDAETPVYNNLVKTLDDFRNSWETRVKNSWHASLLP